jgi:hypothetical protein
MEPSKPEHPSTREEGLKHQNHMAMNVQVLNNPLAQFCCNEHKAIAKAKIFANLEWIGSKLFCKTYLRFLSLHLLN